MYWTNSRGGQVSLRLDSTKSSHYHPSNLIKHIKTEFAVEITYSNALRARELVLEAIYGKHEDAYKAMPTYYAGQE